MANGLANFGKFVLGGAFGATVGATIGLLMAPKSGAQMQADTASYIDTIKTEGERARVEAENEMIARYRARVNDQSALGQKPQESGAS